MLRTVLAVALAAALVAAANPALESTRTTRTDHLVAGELDRIETAAQVLAREESPAPLGDPAPRRTLTVSIPGESPTSAPVDYVALGGLPGGPSPEKAPVADTADRDVFAFRVSGGRQRVRRVDFDFRAAIPADADPSDENSTDGDSRWRVESDAIPIVLRGGATYRLTLRLVRLDGRPTVLATVRGFTTEDGTTSVHARPAGATP